ncbi:hypothetical protein [Companilactobacillus ginsenosidimutans]|nr:hypothetical protein [Companilactobacillus ginsenosidimutans]
MNEKLHFVIVAIICSLIILIPTMFLGSDYLWAYILVAYSVQYMLK